jgi:hypothetical protein
MRGAMKESRILTAMLALFGSRLKSTRNDKKRNDKRNGRYSKTYLHCCFRAKT